MKHISAYPSIYALGHKAIERIFIEGSDIIIEEKIDGSQFSFGRENGEFICRSKGKDIIPDAPEKMFLKGVEIAKSLPVTDGWIYRGEYLEKPKHNTLAYSRIPANHIILFDVQTAPETYLSYEDKKKEAERLGLECVPLLHKGPIDGFDSFKGLLDMESVLGGCKIEGFVVKNYNLFTAEKKVAIGKYVSEAFKEKHQTAWKNSNPGIRDVVQALIHEYKTDARWRKAIQHLRDDGKLEGSPKDIGVLIQEIPADILKDSEQEIKDRLFNHFWPHIRRGVTNGFPEFYKQELAQQAFQ